MELIQHIPLKILVLNEEHPESATPTKTTSHLFFCFNIPFFLFYWKYSLLTCNTSLPLFSLLPLLQAPPLPWIHAPHSVFPQKTLCLQETTNMTEQNTVKQDKRLAPEPDLGESCRRGGSKIRELRGNRSHQENIDYWIKYSEQIQVHRDWNDKHGVLISMDVVAVSFVFLWNS